MKLLIKLILSFFILTADIFADEVIVFNFTESELLNLEVRKVRGADNKTIYSIGFNEKGNFSIMGRHT